MALPSVTTLQPIYPRLRVEATGSRIKFQSTLLYPSGKNISAYLYERTSGAFRLTDLGQAITERYAIATVPVTAAEEAFTLLHLQSTLSISLTDGALDIAVADPLNMFTHLRRIILGAILVVYL